MKFVIFLIAALIVVSSAEGWNRASNPFMRLASKIDTSLVETSSKTMVDNAVQVGGADQSAIPEDEESDQEERNAQKEEEKKEEDANKKLEAKEEAKAEVMKEMADKGSEATSNEAAPAQNAGQADVEALKAKVEQEKVKEAFSKLEDQAKEQAKTTMDNAAERAKEIIEAAKAKKAAAACNGNCDKDKNKGVNDASKYREVTLMKGTKGTEDLDPMQLGLAPTMNVDTPTLRHALKVGVVADENHEKFLDKHEQDCKGPICEGSGGKITASTR